MQKMEVLNYEEQYKDVVISFSPFTLQSMGIIQSQTSLKVDTYTLACVLYQLSMGRTVLIGAFSRDEIAFFQRFKGSLAGLTLVVQHPTAKDPEKIFCRCQVAAVGLMKGREGVGLIVCDFKPIPPALAQLLGEHLMNLERLKALWSDLHDKSAQVTPETSRKLGYNNYAVLALGSEQHKLALFSIAVNRLDFLMPMRSPDMAVGASAAISLFFQKYRFTVAGKIESAQRLPTGVQKVRATMEFSPELCDLMSEYFFAAAHAPKRV